MNDTARIEALWIEPGTPWDVARVANKYRPHDQQLDAAGVIRIWDRAKAEGRLPPFWRPWLGFRDGQAQILRRLMEVGTGRAA